METTDDELIVIWDGWERCPGCMDYFWKHPKFCSGKLYNNIVYPISDMKYKTSFDWIMPVVEKINSVWIDDYTCIHIDANTVFVHLKDDEMHDIPINGDVAILYMQNREELIIALQICMNKYFELNKNPFTVEPVFIAECVEYNESNKALIEEFIKETHKAHLQNHIKFF